MAQCKYCHQTISRIDKEVCPFCGGRRPLDGTDTSTQDVTKVIGKVDQKQIKHKKRVVAALLAIFFGLFGAPHFYIGKGKKGFLTMAICCGFIAAVGMVLLFIVKLPAIWSFLIPYFVIEVYSIITACVYLTNHSIQDSHGEFLD